jgi:uncharacterized protein (TIGR02300 family)
MTEPALGTKRKCLSCGAAFFDLQHDPIVCPRCKAVFTPPPPEPPVYKRKTHAPVEPAHAEEPEAIVGDDPEDLKPHEEPDDDILPLET